MRRAPLRWIVLSCLALAPLPAFGAAGSLDPRFGAGGKVTTGFPGFSNASARALVIAPDGAITVAGAASTPSGSAFGVARYDASGALDPTFVEPYRFADTLLVISPRPPRLEDYVKATEILERGVKNLPYDTELWLVAGQYMAYVARPHLPDEAMKARWGKRGAELLARANEVLGWVRAGTVRLQIDREFTLAQAAEAHKELEGRRTTGKVLLIP